MMIYLLAIIPYFFLRIVNSHPKERFKEVIIACAYVVGSEVFFRMTKAYLFYETGKYLVILFIALGLFYDGFKRKAYPYTLFLLFLIPGILVSYENISYDANFRTMVMFNLSGPICLSVVSIYTYGKSLTYKDFLSILNFLIYPLTAMTMYVILYRPDLRDVITNTAASAAASGGYGPNQVATVFGLGIFVLFSRLFIPYKNKLVYFIMILLLCLMTLRGILTFSRGGILTGAIMSGCFLLFYFMYSNVKSKVSSVFKLGGAIGVVVLIWLFSLAQTGGLIENRYTNRDSLGREKGDITTGRADIIDTELSTFMENPFLGVGVGTMKGIRLEATGIEAATHNEVSRMLSEHGMFGIFALLILIIVPIFNNPLGMKNIYFYPLLLFWFITINHSAMRIAAPAFIYGLSLITITREKKNSVHREQTV